MIDIQLSQNERDTYERLLKETEGEVRRYRRRVIGMSIVVALVIFALIRWYWIGPSIDHKTSLLIGGLFYAFYGGLLLALQAFSSPSTLALMSMSRFNGNSRLFAQLMKSGFSAKVGVCFIVAGFCIQGTTMVVFSG